ncbi:MAG: hypothetical protein ACYSUF_13950 [Planctomycetota bacterium]
MVERTDDADDLAVDADGLQLALVEQLHVLHHRLAGDGEADHLRHRLLIAMHLGDLVGPDDHVVRRQTPLGSELRPDGLLAVHPHGVGDLHVLDQGLGGGNRADHPPAPETALTEHAGQVLFEVRDPGIPVEADRVGDAQAHGGLDRRVLARGDLEQFHR